MKISILILLVLLTTVSELFGLNLNNNSINLLDRTPTLEELTLYNRVKGAENIANPYSNLQLSQICQGSSNGLSGSTDDYSKWEAAYTNCAYLDGNLEITNFKPQKNNNTKKYDFSFLKNITEITGYIIIFNSDIEYLPLENLKIVRGWELYSQTHAIYIDNNRYLKYLDFQNLKEIQAGIIAIQNNPNLCYTNTIDWNDIFSDYSNAKNSLINNNKLDCDSCNKSCCVNVDNKKKCSCWQNNICQRLSKSICDSRCEGRCFGSDIRQCCHPQCAAGCTGPTKHDCLACKRFRVHETGACVENCERIEIADPRTGQMMINPNGMYEYSIACVKSCPSNWVIYREFCLKMCPNGTYDADIAVNSTFSRKYCLPCTPTSCPKSCQIKNDDAIDKTNIHLLKDCQELKGNLKIIHSIDLSDQTNNYVTEDDLEVLKTLRTINGYLFLQSNNLKTLNFLRNLEVVRGRELYKNSFGIVINCKNLKTLNLKSFQKLENGRMVIKSESLCLHDSINWRLILSNTKNTVEVIDPINENCTSDGYVCNSMCSGCWSTQNNMCQLCKTYKLNDFCVDHCNNVTIDNRSLYVADSVNRICEYCHEQCKLGCSGPSEFECNYCANVNFNFNSTHTQCLEECPITHYRNETTNRCLPCYLNCNGCRGPEESTSLNGCISCNKAMVDNDDDYTVLKCIGDDDCEPGYYRTVVPAKLSNHPFLKKVVCRKCHPECETCYGNGNGNCLRCKNLMSVRNYQCVSQCSLNEEFLDNEKKECLPCHVGCSQGCTGQSNSDCRDCKKVRLVYESDKSEIKKLTFNLTPSLLNRTNDVAFIIINPSINKITYCLDKCPNEFPYVNDNLNCMSKKPIDFNKTFAFIVLSVFLVLGISIVALILLIVWCRAKNARKRQIKQECFINGYDINESGKFSPQPNLARLKYLKSEEFKKHNLLGKGAFGCVYKGVWQPKNVKFHLDIAIKELNSDLEKSDELIDEAQIMASVSHPHCLRLIALCMAKPIMIVSPMIKYGSVLNFFSKHKKIVNEKMLLTWCSQIADGMKYLESREIVHRDLAARNVLVQAPNFVKITDFGLSKVLDNGSNAFYSESGSLMPIKWLAPECISQRLYTHKSDVWSFGVTCWELFTFGAKPFEEVQAKEIYSHVKSGMRLAQPLMTTIDVYMKLIKCWINEPESRPSFEKLQSEFERMSKDPKRFLRITSRCYDDPITNAVPNIHELMREISRESELTDPLGIDLIDDGIDSFNFSNIVGVNSLIINENSSEENNAFFSENDSPNNSSGRYFTDPLNQQKLKNSRKNNRIKNRNSHDFQDSAFFDDSERLLRISNTTSSSSSTSNQTESEPANVDLNSIIKSAHDVVEEKFQKNFGFNQSNVVQSIQEKLITNLKENPIYNRSSFNGNIPEIINKNIYKIKNNPVNTSNS